MLLTLNTISHDQRHTARSLFKIGAKSAAPGLRRVMGNGRMFPEIGTIEHKKLRQLLDQHNGDACTWGEGVDIGQNSTNKHVKHCLALLLRFLTLLLQYGVAKVRL